MDMNKILVVDDNELNRAILSEMLSENYEIVEAVDGEMALNILYDHWKEFDLVLLDIVMPKKNGMEVLETMKINHWIEETPVIMISAENSITSIRTAYELGAEDYISRPFDPVTVIRRIRNTILIHAKQKELKKAFDDEFNARERQNDMMVAILSHIVEYRNGESGIHVLHIKTITGIFLRALLARTDRYKIPLDDIPIIQNAASFHDIGKMGVPENILNKPGKLTPEEFEIMKTHTTIGYEMLNNIEEFKDEPLLKYAKEICRHHHEKYDGNGYPDGLVGDEIPIAAQIVSLADVYDALTSERCYKPAYTHKQAVQMIFDNKCGKFNNVLLEVLKDIEKDLEQLPKEKVEDDI